jgi:hypothetical protein
MFLSPGIPDLGALLEKMKKLMSICQMTYLLSLAVLLDFVEKTAFTTFYNIF